MAVEFDDTRRARGMNQRYTNSYVAGANAAAPKFKMPSEAQYKKMQKYLAASPLGRRRGRKGRRAG